MSLENDFGLGETEADLASAHGYSPDQPLPALWYSSQDLYALERRAIFSQKWLLTTHKLRFSKTGDWLRYDVSGYAFILVKDREGNINAFHNVCRHRAFPVVTEEGGTSRIFSCQYHGWSYGLNGKLAKAPGYQDLEGFDKNKNGLLPIHVHIDANGFIWLNLDAAENPKISWDDDVDGTELDSQLELNCENFQFDHSWEIHGQYNWKIPAGRSEKRSRSGVSVIPTTILSHNANSTPTASDLELAGTYYFPSASMIVSPHSFFMQRIVPTGPTTCSMRFEVYRNTISSDEEFQITNRIHQSMMSEDNDVCIQAQQGLHLGLPGDEQLLSFQTIVRDLVTAHHRLEQETGEELWPARQRIPTEDSVSQEDMDFCSKLTSKDGSGLSSGGCCGGGCGGGPPMKPATAPETMVS